MERNYSGSLSSEVSERELKNREIAREAAAEGIVLLKNEGLLPLKADDKVVLFGGGAVATIKGGTGSGDVNEREVVSIYKGFLNAGININNREWLDSFSQIYEDARLEWKELIVKKLESEKGPRLLDIYAANVFKMPKGSEIKEAYFDGVKAAFYVISRTAGEAADRFESEGDYYLTDAEKEELSFIAAHCENVCVIINTGGVIDLKYILSLPNVKALINLVQPGMEGGNALADIITGKVTPSGKLTDTWAENYSDYPNAATFSHMNGNVDREYYEEGIYVGYRYFDSFNVKPLFPFGFGLSYTDFNIKTESVTAEDGTVTVNVTVTNTGAAFSGKEVVQIYASCPQSGENVLEKEYKRLCGFAKTKCLAPGESQNISVTFNSKMLSSFNEAACEWGLDAGLYGIWVGNSSDNVTLSAALSVKGAFTIETLSPICEVTGSLSEISCPENLRLEREESWHKLIDELSVPVIDYMPCESGRGKVSCAGGCEEAYFANEKERLEKLKLKAGIIADRLTDEQMIAMVIGEISKGQGQALGAAGIKVPGAAGETSGILEKEYGIPGVSMADGPAGLRLMKSYEVNPDTGFVYSQGILSALEGGLFAKKEEHPGALKYYQYCTAIPVGTLLAQSFNEELLERVGKAVAVEMKEFGVSWWLAPGMNIHRNPLCGRNFEYYSEDPLVSGRMAAALTRGVQSINGTGTTIKHFACNNQEDNRKGSDSIVSQRALREIYLRGFEIAVTESQPKAIMTSYNLINGVHTANSIDLCTTVARGEWGFNGIIMTDWTTTDERGGSTPWKCAWAGNDLIMPGCDNDVKNIGEALDNGELTRGRLRSCVVRLIAAALETL